MAGERRPRILAADVPLGHLAAVKLDEEATRRLLHGQTVKRSPEGSPEPNTAEAGARLRIYGPGGRFLGLGEWDGAGAVRPRRLFTMR